MAAKKTKPKVTKNPDASLHHLRVSIDHIDEKILGLLNQRAKAALRIGNLKEEKGLTFHAPERERQIYKRLEAANAKQQGEFPRHAVSRVYREILSACLSLEKPLKVAFLGPKASFTHLASIEHFGLSCEAIPLRSIAEVFREVERGKADYGIVPIENSSEGIVNHTLDLFLESPLKIMAERILEIEHHLLARRPLALGAIQSIASHPQALAQCRGFLTKHLSSARLIETESTAKAAQLAAENEQIAAIASGFAAELYGLSVIEESIQDHSDNFTRFLVLSHQTVPKSGVDKTSILFSVKDEPGALYRMLKPFFDQKVNLSKIESRPRKTKPWEYVFFIDVDGHTDDKAVTKAVNDLEKTCTFLKVLGSYPKFIAKKKESRKK